jgi:hypothetical protein
MANQIQNELPFSLPMTPAERPQKKTRTTYATGAARKRPS